MPESRVHASSAASGAYELQEKLGEGGMGVVYKARDKRLDRVVALKLLSPESGRDPSAVRRVLREARASARLDHPNICTVYAVEEIEGGPCIAMQFVEGRTLRQMIAEAPLPLEKFFAIAWQICAALDAAHRRGIIHRDIKSANIMVTDAGQVKVLDFGLAQLSTTSTDASTLTAAMSPAGTLSYMAPDQLKGERADARTDIFSLGVLFFEMLTGKLPFLRETTAATLNAILNDAPPDARELRSDVPETLAHLIRKALSKNRSDRPQTMAEVLAELRASSGDAPMPEVPRERPVIKNLWMALAAVAILAAAGTIALMARRSASQQVTESRIVPEVSVRLPAAKAKISVKQEIPSIASLPFSNLSGDSRFAHLEIGVADALTEAIVRSGRFRLVERVQLDKALQELKLDRSATVDPATAQKIGRLIGARFLAIGSFQVWEGQVRINARLLRVETGEIVGAWNRTGPVSDALRLPDDLGREILATQTVTGDKP